MPSTLQSVDGEVQHPLYWSKKFLVQVSNKNNFKEKKILNVSSLSIFYNLYFRNRFMEPIWLWTSLNYYGKNETDCCWQI
jgi:hypothetical protein